jgi:glycosyltransferase involved in cell wall biosynthesis
LLLRLAKKSDHVFFICKNQQQYYKNSYFFNPPNQEVIYNGINTDHFKTSETNRLVDKRKEMNISDNGEIISLVASIRKEKGHKDAIHALFLLRGNYPNRKNTHLVFVGDGESSYVRELKEMVANKGLNEFVHFEGNQKDVRPYYEVSNLFTLTSYSVETFSIAALEAMSMGLPLSLTNVGGAAEMVTEGKNGALSIPKNPLSIAESWNKILEMNLQRDNIRQIVIEKFSFNQMFAQYKEALK